MKRYLTFDGINCEYEEHNTIEEAREWLEECFLERSRVTGIGVYHPDLTSCYIFELKEKVEYDIIEEKEEGKEWNHSEEVEEIWQHRFEPVKFEQLLKPKK